MKLFGKLLVACALAAGIVASAAAAPPAPQPAISISQLTVGRFELVYSETKFTSRDEIEGQLLLSAARLALAHGQNAFVLLALPGERTDVHPPRRNPAYGSKYGHWQPHWNYYVPEHGWQWWHPEWGAEFWTKDVDPGSVGRFEVHAMIDLGPGASALDESMQFKAHDVVYDLGRTNLLPAPAPSH